MRRWLRHLIPVLILTVTLQVLAPGGLIRAATAAQDPLASVPICTELGLHDPAQPETAQPVHGACCPLCSIVHAPTLPPAGGESLVLNRPYSVLSWTLAAAVRRAAAFASHAQARAPPRLA